MAGEKALQKEKDELGMKLKEAGGRLSPEEAKRAEDELAGLDKRIGKLREDARAAKTAADDLGRAYSRGKERADAEEEVAAGVAEWGARSDDLGRKLGALEKARKELEALQGAMAGSSDHEAQQDSLARLKARLVEVRREADEIGAAKAKLDAALKGNVAPRAAKAKAGALKPEELQELRARLQHSLPEVRRLDARVDELGATVAKKRAKLGDAGVPTLIRETRVREKQQAEAKLVRARERLNTTLRRISAKDPLAMKVKENGAQLVTLEKKLKGLSEELPALEKTHLEGAGSGEGQGQMLCASSEGPRVAAAVSEVDGLGRRMRAVEGELDALAAEAETLEQKAEAASIVGRRLAGSF